MHRETYTCKNGRPKPPTNIFCRPLSRKKLPKNSNIGLHKILQKINDVKNTPKKFIQIIHGQVVIIHILAGEQLFRSMHNSKIYTIGHGRSAFTNR